MAEPAQAIYPASDDFIARAHVDATGHEAIYAASIADPDAFWGEHGRRLDRIRPYSRVKNARFVSGRVDIRWFEDGALNVAVSCIGRHLATRADRTAIIGEPGDPATPARHISDRELHEKTCRMANVLLSRGVMRGDRVTDPSVVADLIANRMSRA